MIQLDKSGLIGKGLHRECYRHPGDANLCIKVVVSGGWDETRREKKYYQHLERRGISWDMIPRYYGDVDTNLGPGAVFDLVADHGGEVSKTLEYYLSGNEQAEQDYDNLLDALSLLKDYLLQQRIVTMTLKPKNISCKKLESGAFRLFVVDNIGNPELTPICNHSKYFANRKTLRKWKQFEERMLNTYGQNAVLQRMLTGLAR